MRLINTFNTLYKMDEIIENILRINCLSYNKQCGYVKYNLLSLDPLEITHTVFFLRNRNLIIGKGDETFFKFWSEFEDNCYLYATKGSIKLKYVKLSNNKYLISIPSKSA